MRTQTTVAAGIKTIILTTTIDSYNGLTVEVSISRDGSAYNVVCSACYLGTNDFSSSNSNTGLTSFNYLKVVWQKGRSLCLCEVWAYTYKNYVPSATITGYGTGISSPSVTFSSYATNPSFMCLKNEDTDKFYTGGAHTCIFNDKSNGLTYIVIDFPQPMVFYEFQSSGGSYDVLVYLIDPRSTLMQKTAG